MKKFNYTVPVTVEIKNLTLGECKLFTEWGYSPDDVKQIDDAVTQCKYSYVDENGKKHRISCKKAHEMVGGLDWCSGIGRAAFHWTSIRYIDNSDYGKGYVEFDNRSMFA